MLQKSHCSQQAYRFMLSGIVVSELNSHMIISPVLELGKGGGQLG
jgi:hypothetical protein